jgi:hypothetical protein
MRYFIIDKLDMLNPYDSKKNIIKILFKKIILQTSDNLKSEGLQIIL